MALEQCLRKVIHPDPPYFCRFVPLGVKPIAFNNNNNNNNNNNKAQAVICFYLWE
jgi:hypothetical protein